MKRRWTTNNAGRRVRQRWRTSTYYRPHWGSYPRNLDLAMRRWIFHNSNARQLWMSLSRRGLPRDVIERILYQYMRQDHGVQHEDIGEWSDMDD